MACPIENRAACIRTNRKIQKNTMNEEAPLGLAHVPPRGHYKTERTWYFDMVAELAIELARIC
eukprot:6205722-Amphidinium_carterae.1